MASHLAPIASFIETEGLTLIIPQENADNAHLSYEGVFQSITLTVHSSLEAVGLTAAVASALAQADISANVVAAFYHDHVFVPTERAAEALAILQSLASVA